MTKSTSNTRAPMAADVLAITLKGAKMTDNYIITQPMGTSKKGPLERWFEKARLVKFDMAKGGDITIHTHREYLAKRGIAHADLEVITAAEPAAPKALPAPEAATA